MPTTRGTDYVKLALPKGRLLPATACLLTEIGLEFENYTPETRIYRLQSMPLPHVSAKMFQEKDIPVQVAVGNYDLGICGLDRVEELLTRYPASALVKVLDLEYDKGKLIMAASQWGNIPSFHKLAFRQDSWRIVTEYPNLAEASALNLRLRRFKIFPVCGAAEAYPPENADLVLLRAKDDQEVDAYNLVSLKTVLSSNAFLIANRESWQTKNIAQIVAQFSQGRTMASKPWLQLEPKVATIANGSHPDPSKEKAWLAIPDGHQQRQTSQFLNQAGLKVEGYSANAARQRPGIDLDWLNVKVVRPQDMPLQVANGNFDLAITGKDWLLDHLYRFPSSPATELAELGFGAVKVVAVATQDLPLADINDLNELIRVGKLSPLRVASEYTNIADRYLHDNHVSRYKLIPTSGASEALLPEDADLLIENTQTGKTLAQHNLRVVDTILRSTACLIGNKNNLQSSTHKERIASLIELLRQTAQSN